MANKHDSALVQEIIRHQQGPMAATCAALAPQIGDDATYWLVVASCWIAAGVAADVGTIWRPLFTADRGARWKMMKPPDRRRWRSLPDVVVVHRAVAPNERHDDAIAWTLDKAVCERLYPTRKIVTRRVPKTMIEALWTRRGEAEVLILSIPKPEKP